MAHCNAGTSRATTKPVDYRGDAEVERKLLLKIQANTAQYRGNSHPEHQVGIAIR
jgi:hypothetical protein